MYKYIVFVAMVILSSCTYQPARLSADGGYEVFFDADSDNLDEASKKILRAVAHVSTRAIPKKILINGNADRSGSLQHNKELSLRRAQRVAGFLENRGISPDIMDIRSYGASVAWNDKLSEDSNRQHRNVKIILLKYNKIEYR
jgi:outer membrane protein OmpA-like peptidoglycan-associated protein